jgi:hypothetical protein
MEMLISFIGNNLMTVPNEYMPVNNLVIETNLYRDLTKLSYGNNIPISGLINDMLKEFMHTYILSKNMGHMLLSKDIAKVAINEMTEEQIKQAAKDNANRYREGAILENSRPSLSTYLRLISSFARANKFDIEVSKNPETENQVLIAQFRMGIKFSQYKAETYKMLLQEFADVGRTELTDTMIYIEFKPKKDQVLQQAQRQ